MKEERIRIVRYADDLLIFARTPRQDKRYEKTAYEILEGELKVVVNKEKTHVTSIYQGVAYLGFIIYTKNVCIHPEKVFAEDLHDLPVYSGSAIVRLDGPLQVLGQFRLSTCSLSVT
jgi:hypothetical protein